MIIMVVINRVQALSEWLERITRFVVKCGYCGALQALLISALFIIYDVYADEQDAPSVHVLIVCDTNDMRIGKHVETDRLTVTAAVEQAIPPHRRTLKILKGDEATPQNVLQYYRNLKNHPDDTLVFYYAGHGEIDDRYGHVLTMQTANLSRRTLVSMIDAKRARLKVILTDCCSLFGEVPHAYTPMRYDSQTVRYLFFRHRGTVDLTASELGQPAYGTQDGGIFTNALFGLLTLSPEQLDQDADGVPSWNELWDKLKESASAKSSDLLARDRRLIARRTAGVSLQQPHAFTEIATPIGNPLPKPKARLGVRVQSQSTGGVKVIEVVEHSPAAWFGIQLGDVITGLDTTEIKNEADLREALAAKPEGWPFLVRCDLIRAANGVAGHLDLRLAW